MELTVGIKALGVHPAKNMLFYNARCLETAFYILYINILCVNTIHVV